jgi:hypothetical protein
VDFTRADQNKIMTGLVTGLALLTLTSCNRHPPVEAVAPPQPVGHVYATQVAVPPPVSARIHFTDSQEEQAQQAFNVISLKSALMVAALSCEDQAKYDAFMSAFQPYILTEQHVMDAYFYKASGPYSGRQMEDNFITLLANNQSISGIGQGRTFCLNSQAEYTAVSAMKTPDQLDRFVTDEPPGAMPGTTATVMVASATAPVQVHHVEVRREHYRHVAVKHTVTKTKTKTTTKASTQTKTAATSQP